MASNAREAEQALLALAPEERAAVIRAGFISLESDDSRAPQEEIDAAWRTELDNRLGDVLHGRVTLGTFEATRQRFAATYRSPDR